MRARTENMMENKSVRTKKTPGENGFQYKEQFGVIVVCKDEDEHKAVYERLKNLGYNCKVVRV